MSLLRIFLNFTQTLLPNHRLYDDPIVQQSFVSIIKDVTITLVLHEFSKPLL
jgi:hypothetical protein